MGSDTREIHHHTASPGFPAFPLAVLISCLAFFLSLRYHGYRDGLFLFSSTWKRGVLLQLGSLLASHGKGGGRLGDWIGRLAKLRSGQNNNPPLDHLNKELFFWRRVLVVFFLSLASASLVYNGNGAQQTAVFFAKQSTDWPSRTLIHSGRDGVRNGRREFDPTFITTMTGAGATPCLLPTNTETFAAVHRISTPNYFPLSR